MSNTQVVRKIIEKLAREVRDWDVKSSNMHPSDADWYIGFKSGVEENEYDPKTGRIVKNDDVASSVSYLNHWDADNTGYLESEDVKRDNGGGLARIVMQQITPIKS